MRLRWAALHVAALWTLAVVQPLFDLLGRTPGFFVARANTAGDVLLLAFGWTLGPPLLALAALTLARRLGGARAFTALHLTLVAILVALLVAGLLEARAPVVVPAAVLVAAALTRAYARAAPVRTFVSILGVAPAVVLALFLLSAPVRDVVLPPDEAGAAATTIKDPAPVVVLIFDELPTLTLLDENGGLDATRFPHFARLARKSTWYPNATTVADGTYVAVPALLTGERPQQDVPATRAYPDSLFTLLGGSYDLHVHEPMTVVCPEALCGARDRPRRRDRLTALAEDLWAVQRRLLLPTDLRDGLPPIDRDVAGFAAEAGESLAEARLRGARETVAGIARGARPGLWLVHHVIPHVPWQYLADGTRYGVEGPSVPGLDDQTWGTNPYLVDQARQRHTEMARFADTLLGEALGRLQQAGLYQDALIVVTADHGVAFGPGRSRRPVTEDNFAEVAGVPLFVKAPGQAQSRTDDAFVTTLDVVPTIADVVGAETDRRFDGAPVDAPRDTETLTARNGREATLVRRTPAQFRAALDAALTVRRDGPPSPRPGLIGQPAAAAGPPLPEAQIAGPSRYEDVRPRSGLVPAYVTGETSATAPGTPLALAVNGRIAATGEAYGGRFSFLLDRTALRSGPNALAVHEIDP